MKKIYIAPALVAVELEMRSEAMLSVSSVDGENIIPDGGDGDGGDVAAKGFSSDNFWDNEW